MPKLKNNKGRSWTGNAYHNKKCRKQNYNKTFGQNLMTKVNQKFIREKMKQKSKTNSKKIAM